MNLEIPSKFSIFHFRITAGPHTSIWPDRAKKRSSTGGGVCVRATENVASEKSMIHRWIEEVEKIIGSLER